MKEDSIQNPLVSIIVPIYNGEKYISKTILSVISQNYDNWELILIDDGSSDRTLEIIKDFERKDKRISSVSLEESSGGPAKPRNIGLNKANGNYIAFLDSDDEWDREKLSFQVKVMLKDDLDILSNNVRVIDTNDHLLGEINKSGTFNFLKIFFGTFNCLLIFNPINLSSSIFKKGKKIKFREDKNLQSIEDWAYWLDHAFMGVKIRILSTKLTSYRSHKKSISKINGKIQYFKGFVLYSNLLAESKIGLFKFILLTVLHLFRSIAYFIKKK